MYRRMLVVLAALALCAFNVAGAFAASPIQRVSIPLQDLGTIPLGPLSQCLGGAEGATLNGSGILNVMFNNENGKIHARENVSGTFTAVGADGTVYTGSYDRVQMGMGQGSSSDIEQAQPRVFTVLLHASGTNTSTGEPISFVEVSHMVLSPDGTVRVEFDKVICPQ